MEPLDSKKLAVAYRSGWFVWWLGIGLANQIIYHGLPHPLRLADWFHILAWPVGIILMLLRFAFPPIALIALIGFLGLFAIGRRR